MRSGCGSPRLCLPIKSHCRANSLSVRLSSQPCPLSLPLPTFPFPVFYHPSAILSCHLPSSLVVCHHLSSSAILSCLLSSSPVFCHPLLSALRLPMQVQGALVTDWRERLASVDVLEKLSLSPTQLPPQQRAQLDECLKMLKYDKARARLDSQHAHACHPVPPHCVMPVPIT